MFARSAATGTLAMTDCIAWQDVPGCQDLDATGGFGVEISPDGTRAIVGAGDVAGFGVYNFDEATGRLTQLPGEEGCYSGSLAPGCAVIAGGFAGKSTWAPDGLHVYVVPSSSLLNVRQDLAPVCSAVSVAVPINTATKIPLTCTDANGDPITIVTPVPPKAGSLGSVDQTTDSVVYTPTTGYSGSDSFTYTATADGRTSAPATVSITVPALPPPPPAVDETVTLTIKGGTLNLSNKGKTRVRLTCSATEPSGPCTGKLTMRTRGKVPVGNKRKVVVLATAKYSVPAGTSKKVVLKLSTKSRVLLLTVAAASKVVLVAKVRDTVGNKATIKTKAKFPLP